MLLAEDLGKLNDGQREYLEHVLQLDDFMIGLITSWSDIERLSNGQVMLNIEPCNIGSAAAALLPVTRSGQWPMVLADPLRLRQILMNCLNCLKNPAVRARITGDVCVLTLEDRTMRSHDDRADMILALQGEATAAFLGLRIARLLAEAHGGSLQLDPHAANGTKLRLRLPLAKQMSLLGDAAE